ncbi:mitochondrial protein Pet127-domain-containing protein [Scleroderma yunnanense]
MRILENAFACRIVVQRSVMQTLQRRNTCTLRMFCVPLVSQKSNGPIHTVRSLLMRLSAQRHAFISTGMQAKKPHNPKIPRHNKPHGIGTRINARPRKKVPHVLKAYIKRREALLSTVLQHLERVKAVDAPKTVEASSEGKSISRKESMIEDEPSQASTTAKLHDPLDQDGSGFRPEKWSSGWGSDALAPPTTTQGTSPTFKRRLPPHVRSQMYTRRTEGFIDDRAQSVDATHFLQDVQSPSEQKPIAQLAHGLSRVLFNPGVHWLQDPRSRVYNFTPWLEDIPRVNDFAFERVTGFIKSSQDTDLHNLAKQYNRPFVGSTSSLTGLLSHIYFLLSGDREIDVSPLSRAFAHESTTFTPGQRMPTSVILNYKDDVWSIDSDKANAIAEKNVLSWMGTMLEKFLTLSEQEFKKLLRSAPDTTDAHDSRREAYRYAMSDSFIMRSQLDCIDPRLPGTGVFDIKTRAAVPIRLDILNYEENSGYLIKTLTGSLESFEKEYYDLIRSAFLKYSFQARIGNMDGVLVAYHNTARIFGFQYIPIEDMEARLYGTGDGARVFNRCLRLLECVLKEVVGVYGGRSVRCTFDKRDHFGHLDIFVEPADWNEAPEKPSPITQFEVQVENFLDSLPVRGSTAVASHKPWLLQWSISQSAMDESDIRQNLAYSQSRQLRALNFPTGVKTLAEMEAYWERINFGTPKVTKEPTSNGRDGDGEQAVSSSLSHSLAFRSAPPEIEHLRKLAREGRDETLRIEAEEASSGRGKIVWGLADVLSGIDESESGESEADSSEIGFEDTGELTGVSVSQPDEVLPSVSDESSDGSAYETDSSNDHKPSTSKSTS